MWLDKIARLLVLSVIFILPLFAIPLPSVPFGFSKSAFFIIATALALILWSLARLRDGAIMVSRGVVLPLLALVVLVSVIATLASGAVALSWSGAWFDIGSLAFFLSLAVFLFLCVALIRSGDHIFYAFFLFVGSAALLALFHLIRFAGGPELFSFDFFVAPSDTLLGRWNDLAVFFGAVAVFLLTTLEFMQLRTGLRVALLVGLIASLIILAAVNMTLVWMLLAVFSLVFMVYLISFKHMGRAQFDEVRHSGGEIEQQEIEQQEKTEDTEDTVSDVFDATSDVFSKRKIPPLSGGVFVLSLVFVLFAGPLGGAIAGRLGVSVIEARPSFGATMSVARETLKSSPFFGAGPNLFSREWLAFKPSGVNQTIFWNTDFVSGIGFLPTMLVTTGIIGILVFALFLIAYAVAGFRFILSSAADKVSRYLVGAPFLVSLFLWCVLFFYASGASILVFVFAFTGITLAALASHGRVRVWKFTKNPSFSFAAVLALILISLLSAALVWSVGNRFVSAYIFSEGLRVANTGGQIDQVEALVSRALARSPRDLYARTLAEVMLARMNTVAQDTSRTPEVARAEFQELLGRAVGYGRQAVSLDAGDYSNWLALGRVYEAVLPLQIEGAYEAARAAYEEALARNPRSPAILLIIARLEAAKGDGERSREFITRSLQEKSNYTEAVFFLSQLEVQEGNIAGAINSVEAAIILSQNDPVLRFQLGLLKYNQRDWRGSVAAFERAVALNPNYANARYFLGLSYERLNRDAEAIAQFEELARTNGDNTEVALVLRNLRAGRAPFADATPPVDATPERRSELPVVETEE